VSIRGSILENFAGDLEYHPRRAVLYFVLGALSLCVWIFSPPEKKFLTTPLVFALGSIGLLGKGIYLLRKSSEGLGLTYQQTEALSGPSNRKNFNPFPVEAAQILQDFGAGPLLLPPLLNMGVDINSDWNQPPKLSVFLTGVILFGLGWLIRQATKSRSAS
jgi:hypothetical protein